MQSTSGIKLRLAPCNQCVVTVFFWVQFHPTQNNLFLTPCNWVYKDAHTDEFTHLWTKRRASRNTADNGLEQTETCNHWTSRTIKVEPASFNMIIIAFKDEWMLTITLYLSGIELGMVPPWSGTLSLLSEHDPGIVLHWQHVCAHF